MLKQGLTLVEMVLVIAIIAILASVVVLTLNPQEYAKKSRDLKRIDYIGQLSAAIEDYKLDNGEYPGVEDVVYTSNNAVGNVWITSGFSNYIVTQYKDPTNDDDYNFRYTHTQTDYEIDAKMEINLTDATGDSGNNNTRYEAGTDLTLLN